MPVVIYRTCWLPAGCRDSGRPGMAATEKASSGGVRDSLARRATGDCATGPDANAVGDQQGGLLQLGERHARLAGDNAALRREG